MTQEPMTDARLAEPESYAEPGCYVKSAYVRELVAEVHRRGETSVQYAEMAGEACNQRDTARARVSELEAELVAVRASVDRVRELHRRIVGSGTPHCSKCVSNSWPCPTVRALDGGA